jgi:hypothetical protein
MSPFVRRGDIINGTGKNYIPSRNIKSSNKKKRSDLPMDKKTMDKIILKVK